MHDMSNAHARAALAEWRDMHSALNSPSALAVNGDNLTIGHVIAIACRGAQAELTKDRNVLDLVDRSVAFLQSELAAGKVIYGVNTGFGGSADTRTQDFERLQSAAIQHLNVGILLESDKGGKSKYQDELLRSHALPSPIVKAAMLIRCNSLMRGHSGVRLSVIESVMTLLARNMTPVVPLRGSISASGDLSTLSYIAGAIEGNPDVYLRLGGGDVVPASKVLSDAGVTPVRLQAKEGLGITNGTAPSCAAACIAVHQANQLALLTQLLTAMGTEALQGTAHNYHPFISDIRPHAGQAEAAANILKFLSGSQISPDRGPDRVGLAQDRYALRTAPQWIGPQLEDLALATRQVTVELNSTTDNPLIDVASGRVHHGGNFQAAAITSAMEKTLVALQNLGRLLFAQSSELINNMTNKGLPPNLCADEPSGSFTFKGFDVNMAAYMAELAYLARPISTHVQVAEMANQSVNSMALASARYALEAVEVLSLMAATYLYTLCQALDLRVFQTSFHGDIWDVVSAVGVRYFGNPDTEPGFSDQMSHVFVRFGLAVARRWDELSHVDTPERCARAIQDCMGSLLADLVSTPQEYGSLDGTKLLQFQQEAVAQLEDRYSEARNRFLANYQYNTRRLVSPATMVVYECVRKELGIPLNRGVVDHPPLVMREMQTHANGKACGHGDATENGEVNAKGPANGNGHVSIGKTDTDHASRLRIMGTMAGEIYEAIRSGVLHDRIMEFCQRERFWG